MLLRVARSEAASAVLVVFDSETGSFRDQEASWYKSTRVRDFSDTPPDQNPFAQLTPLKAALDVLEWRHCEIDGIEADDVIAAYARNLSARSRVVIVSADNDMLQLVTSTVTVIAGKNRVYTPAHVLERYGVAPHQLPLLKALAGDPSDNIPGIPHIGLKTARQLLQQFGTVEQLYSHLSELPPRCARSLEGRRGEVEAMLRLIALDRPVALPYAVDELAIRSIDSVRTMEVLQRAGLI
jgi:DNA polymerase-1